MSAAVVAVMCAIMMVVGRVSFDGEYTWFSKFAWLSLASLAGTWAILIPGKMWEGRTGEVVLRRFTMLAIGLIVGAVAFTTDAALMVNLTHDWSVRAVPWGEFVRHAMYTSDGSPQIQAYLAYFAALFLVLRWWRLADPMRTVRLSFWATLTCVLWAFVLHLFWPFPQPWGLMLAAIVAISTQLSASWMSPKERSRARRQALEA